MQLVKTKWRRKLHCVTTPVNRCEERKRGYRTRLVEHSVGYASVRRRDSTLGQSDPVGPRPARITPSGVPLSFCGFANATGDAWAGRTFGSVQDSITTAVTGRRRKIVHFKTARLRRSGASDGSSAFAASNRRPMSTSVSTSHTFCHAAFPMVISVISPDSELRSSKGI